MAFLDDLSTPGAPKLVNAFQILIYYYKKYSFEIQTCTDWLIYCGFIKDILKKAIIR